MFYIVLPSIQTYLSELFIQMVVNILTNMGKKIFCA